MIAGILKTGGAIYFVSYYMKRPDLVSTVLVIILCTRFVGAMSTTLLYKNFDRVRAYKLTLVIQAVILTALFAVPAESVMLICSVICLIHFIDSSSAPLQWSLLSDIIDNVEKKSNRSLSGLVFSTNLFAIKIGIAVGGAIIGWLLTFGGYIGNAAMQTDLAIMTVRLIFTIIPAVFVLIMFFIMQQYRSYAA
nr:MFS transporter [Citrobacter amalonaticus]